MSRAAIAAPLGILGFLAYIALVVVLADQVIGAHWAVQATFYLLAGIAWAAPAHWLILWAGRAR
jgi:hypothetical protein